MGLVTSKLLLKNPRLPALQPIEVDALADSGAVHLCIPEQVRSQLRLVIPKTRTLDVNPSSPNIGTTIAKIGL